MSRSVVVVAPADSTAREEYLTVPEVAARFKLSRKTVRNRMYDGTWKKGLIWFSPPPPPTGGLAYGPEIPPRGRGRPRRVDATVIGAVGAGLA